MKKIICFVCLLLLVGCNSKNQENQNANEAVNNTQKVENQKTEGNTATNNESETIITETDNQLSQESEELETEFSNLQESVFQGNISFEESKQVVEDTQTILKDQGLEPIEEESVHQWITKIEGPKIVSIAKTSSGITKVIYEKETKEPFLIVINDKKVFQR